MINNLANKPKIRCAIYTRKSSEDGLEQEFNSLDAQRLSGENFIASQASKGWIAMPDQYNDGGFSGGNLDRPALKRLLKDIENRKVDCVVVYKIDRLTRSLFDFQKIIEVFDQNNVSFVSVTQSFNTCDSMGRLMLNVLLSFAQYERELTGERIRDKFEASCQKGMWMGGYIPIGYDLKDRKLIINEDEARIIRILFQIFIKATSVTDTFRELNNLGFKTKTWISRSETVHKGNRFNKSNVRRILTNELYFGKINHKGKIYDGQHEAIIDENTWNKAQDILHGRQIKVLIPSSRISAAPLLKGLMNCGVCGSKMTPTYTTKQGRKYRYYICQAKLKGNNEECQVGRIPASEAEELVTNQVLNILQKPEMIASVIQSKDDQTMSDYQISDNQISDNQISDNQIIKAFQSINKIWDELFPVEQARIINLLVQDIIIKPDGLKINIYKQGLTSLNNEING